MRETVRGEDVQGIGAGVEGQEVGSEAAMYGEAGFLCEADVKRVTWAF